MMKLSEIREAYEALSGKLSDVNRQLCFAGFAIIWIFNQSKNNISVPDELYMPALLLCASMFFDILQYVISTLTWYIYYIYKRDKNKNDNENTVNEPEYFNALPWGLFTCKIILLIIAYIKIGLFLISKI